MGPPRRVVEIVLAAIAGAALGSCSPAEDCHLDIGYNVVATGHQKDACVLTLHADRALVFDIPACGATGCEPGSAALCTDREPQGPSVGCSRSGDEIAVGADPETSNAIIKAVGSTTVAVDLTCGGFDVPGAAQSDAAFEMCAK